MQMKCLRSGAVVALCAVLGACNNGAGNAPLVVVTSPTTPQPPPKITAAAPSGADVLDSSQLRLALAQSGRSLVSDAATGTAQSQRFALVLGGAQ